MKQLMMCILLQKHHTCILRVYVYMYICARAYTYYTYYTYIYIYIYMYICTRESAVFLWPRLPHGRLAFERQQDRPMATSRVGSSLEASNPSKNPCRVVVSTIHFTSKLIQLLFTTEIRGFNKMQQQKSTPASK